MIRKVAILTAFVFMVAMNAYGFQFPSAGPDDEGLQEFMEKTTESDVESGRAEKPSRKASQDKSFMYGDDLAEIENTYYPPFDQSPWNWDVPDWWIDWPDFPPFPDYDIPPWYVWPVDTERPPAYASLSCKNTFCPDVVYCEDEYFEWENIATAAQVVFDVSVTSDLGGLLDWEWDNEHIGVWVRNNATDLDEIHISFYKTFLGYPGPPVLCEKDVIIRCEECECSGFEPTIYGDDNFAAGGHADIYVDSDGGACPPYDWVIDYSSSDGQGFHFDSAAGPTTATTNADLEVVSVYADGTACGTATITVTDDCGETAQAYIRYTSSGSWKNTSDYSYDCSGDSANDSHCCLTVCVEPVPGVWECRPCGGLQTTVSGGIVGTKYRERGKCWSKNSYGDCNNSGSCHGLFSHDCSNDSQAGYSYIEGINIQEWKCP